MERVQAGSLVTIRIETWNRAVDPPVLYAPSSVKVTVTSPTGAVVVNEQTMSTSVTGVYTYLYQSATDATLGDYTVQFKLVDSNGTTYWPAAVGFVLVDEEGLVTQPGDVVDIGNAQTLLGFTWAAPGAIGSTSPNTGAFTTLTATTVTGSTYVAGPLLDKGGAIYNVKNPTYGAVGDGVTDDRAAILAAATAAGATGTVFLPPGTYLIATAWAYSTKIRLVGAGMGRTTIKFDNRISVSSITRASTTATVTTAAAHGYTTGHVVGISGATQSEYNGSFTITVTGVTTFTYSVSGSPASPATGTIKAADQAEILRFNTADSYLSDFTIDGNYSTHLNIADVALTPVGARTVIERVEIIGCGGGINVANTDIVLRDVVATGLGSGVDTGAASVGIYSGGVGTERLVLERCRVTDWWLVGFFGQGRLTDCYFTQNHHQVVPTGGGQVANALIGGPSGPAGRLEVINTIIENGGAGSSGLELNGNCLVVGGRVENHPNMGIIFQDSAQTDYKVIGTTIKNSSMSSAGLYGGIRVNPGVTDWQIIGATAYDDQTPKTQSYGIEVMAGASDQYVIFGNNLTDNLTAELSDGGTGTSKVVQSPTVGFQTRGPLKVFGATSGSVSIAVPAAAGSNTLTLPAGTTNLSSTGPGVVQQGSSGAALTVSTVNLASTNFVTGTLPAANGGTGIASYTGGDLLVANGTTSLTKLTAGALAGFLQSIGAGSAPAYFVIPVLSAQAAPGTPASTTGYLYLDSTSKNLALKNDAGTVNHGIQSVTGAIADDGSITSSGSGGFVRVTSATLVTPTLGAATATSINGLTITSSTGTLTVTNGKTLSVSNTLTFTGTDSSSVAFGAGGTVLYSGGALGTPSSGTLTNCTGLPVSTGISGLGTGVATALAVNTGSAGAIVLFNGALGTPTSGTLTNATGLPISTGVSGLGSNVATFLATPSSANLASALTDETGSGANVFATSPTITTPNIVGSSTNDSASAGSVGEHQISTVVSGSAVTLTTATAANVTSLSLTAGDWDVWGNVALDTTGGPSATQEIVWVSTTSATVPSPLTGAVGAYSQLSYAGRDPSFDTMQTGARRLSLSSTTTVYLGAYVIFTGGTAVKAYGSLQARRRR